MTTIIARATLADAEAILELQKLAYQSEAQLYDDWSIPPLVQTLESLRQEFSDSIVLKAMDGERLIGSVRAKATQSVCAIGRLIVDPEFQRRGIGSQLLQQAEASFPAVSRFELFTGSRSGANIRLYRRHGYVITRTQSISPHVILTFMEKTRTENADVRTNA